MNGESKNELWRKWSPEELHRQYSPSIWNHRDMTGDQVIDIHCKVLKEGTLSARALIGGDKDVCYGEGVRQRMDFFMPDDLPSDAPILVYIHGGYWHLLGKDYGGFMGETFTEAGIGVVSVGYDLAPNVSVSTIVQQIKRAVLFIMHYAKRRQTKGLYLCGHSCGAHLAAMMLTVDWLGEFMQSSSLIKGLFLVSGIYDLVPMVYCPENETLKMNENEAIEISPIRQISSAISHCKSKTIVVAVGQYDSPEFKRQSREYAEALLKGGLPVKYQEVLDVHHFDIIERLSDRSFPLTKDLIDIMLRS